MKVKYEYDIVSDNEVLDRASTRQEARDLKNFEKLCGYNAKIVQRVYKLDSVKEVR